MTQVLQGFYFVTTSERGKMSATIKCKTTLQIRREKEKLGYARSSDQHWKQQKRVGQKTKQQ